jgi:hypothetical protein
MSNRIPTDDRLSEIVSTVMKKNQQIRSQSEFTNLVRKELKKDGEDYRVSAERVRRVSIERGLVKLSIEYRNSDSVDLPAYCPVCKNAMDPVMNRSLEGDIVEIKRKCTVCPYTIGGRIMSPGRYVFNRTSKSVTDEDIRLRQLRKARAKMIEATKLIENALTMSGLEDRGNEAAEKLKELADSREMSCSIYNIVADLKQIDDRGTWARPTVSLKNENRKDI